MGLLESMSCFWTGKTIWELYALLESISCFWTFKFSQPNNSFSEATRGWCGPMKRLSQVGRWNCECKSNKQNAVYRSVTHVSKKIDKLSFTTPVGGVLVLGWMVTTHDLPTGLTPNYRKIATWSASRIVEEGRPPPKTWSWSLFWLKTPWETPVVHTIGDLFENPRETTATHTVAESGGNQCWTVIRNSRRPSRWLSGWFVRFIITILIESKTLILAYNHVSQIIWKRVK